MTIGVTGHQERSGIDWSWVRHALLDELVKLGNITKAFSSLAAGSDQLFAEVALSLGIPIVAVLPLEGYERFFQGVSLANFRRLLEVSEVIQLSLHDQPEQAFFEAGKFIVERCDLLLAIWDGQAAEGLGGTGDVVSYARQRQKPVIHVNPACKLVFSLARK